VVSLTNQDPVLTEFTELLGEQGGETMDILARDVYVAGTNVYYAGSYADDTINTTGEVNTAPVTADFKKIRETMVGNKAKMISPHMMGSTKQGTMPVAPAYYGIAHYELQSDLEDMTGWQPAYQYPNGMPSYPSEIGALSDANCRFLITQNGQRQDASGGSTGAGSTYRSTDDSSVNVYTCLVFAKDAVGEVPLDGESMRQITKALGSSGSADPLDQRGSVGWKAFSTWVILNDLWLVRGEFAATL
jgi:N4-gp56 family major capsid protein